MSYELVGENMDRPIFWLDLETTGLSPEDHGIVQIAGIVDRGGRAIDTVHEAVCPYRGCSIQPQAIDVGPFTKDQLYDFPDEQTVYESIKETLEQYTDDGPMILGGHNADDFDRPFFEAFWERQPMTPPLDRFIDPDAHLDTLEIGKIAVGDQMHEDESYSLENMAETTGLGEYDWHDATEDITATWDMFWNWHENYENDPDPVFEREVAREANIDHPALATPSP